MSELQRRLAAIAGDDEWTRHRTLEELRADGLTAPEIHHLGECLTHDDATIRASARMALAALAAPGSASSSEAQSELRSGLASDRENLRILAASSLGEAGDPDAGPALVDALTDPSPNVAAAAADALGALRYAPAVDALGELSATTELWVRAAAIVALGRIEDGRAIPILDRLAAEPGLEKPIAEALGRINEPAALDVLRRVHRTAPAPAVRAAGGILAAHPDLEPPAWVIATAAERDETLRYELIQDDEPGIARLVGLAGSTDSVECLVDLIGPPRWSEAAITGLLAVAPDRRGDAIIARLPDAETDEAVTLLSLLPPLRDPARIRALVPLLGHDSDRVRGAAAEALARAPTDDALSILAAEMGRKAVAPEVVRALGNLGEAACASLVPLLSDPSAPVRAAAASALVRCASPGLVDSLRSALEEEEDPDVRAALLRGLGRAAGADALDVLERALRSDGEGARLAAIEGLGSTGAEAAIRPLEGATGGTRAETLAAIRALGDLALPAAAPALRPYLDSDDLDVRQTAARAALSLATELDADAVAGLATDDDGWVRTCAARILARRGESGRGHLQEMADRDPDPAVRSVARRELGGDG